MTSETPRPRPSRLDSPVAVGVLGVLSLTWAFFAVGAFVQGLYALAVVDGLLLIASVWTITRILRRRRLPRESRSH